MWDLLKMLASLVLVFGLLGLLLWALKRLQQRLHSDPTGQRQLRVLETLHLGARQKIALLEVDNQRVLVGITGQHMQALGQWPLSAGPHNTTNLPNESDEHA